MKENLKARLSRLRDAQGKKPDRSIAKSPGSEGPGWPEWTEAGFNTIKRTLTRKLPCPFPDTFLLSLAILIPDILRLGRIPAPEELLFFDLETTGLSGGAGTVAFLAAFGRFTASTGGSPARMEITQYLLLDYPGECDFVELLVREFALAPPPLVVSYNGKSFDSQILKTRCLMNRITPPDLYHADLLHPARRLWKRLMPDCSQTTIEVYALGLDRTGDVPGAMAPEIWFSFLRSGDNSDLLSICEHNVRDITGLASIFLVLGEIAAKPLSARFRFDEEALALHWRKTLRKSPWFFGNSENCVKNGQLLLEKAAKNGSTQAAIALAMDAEWRLKDPALALNYTKSALASFEVPDNLREELEKRRKRLEGKIEI